jgi:signal transduction histidine kinase
MTLDFFDLVTGMAVLVPLLLLGYALLKKGLRAEMARGLYVLLVIYFFVFTGNFLRHTGVECFDRLPVELVDYGYIFAVFMGSVVIHNLSASLARRVLHFLPWNLVGLIGLFLSFGLAFLPLNSVTLASRWELSLSTTVFGLLLVGWIFFTLLTTIDLIRNYRQYHFPTLRYRLFLWGLALGILLVGNTLIFLQFQMSGMICMALGLVSISFILQTPRLPHLGIVLRKVANRVVRLSLEFFSYTVIFFGLQYLLKENFLIRDLVVAAIISLILIVLANPLLKRFLVWIDQLFFGAEQDVKNVLREFSQEISNILDMELLSAVVVNMMQDLLDVEGGVLFLVELEIGLNGTKQYIFKEGPMRKKHSHAGLIPYDSPLAQIWDQGRQALTQAEIEMLPIFRSLSSDTRRWLTKLKMEIYVPIHAQDEWVGLLALGPKTSGASFYSEDIELLGTLADQTAVALQNAHLVESLMRVNAEFRKAYASMEAAHSKLQKIDRTKSDFISISSHELRTPLTILSGYSQILMDAPDIKEHPVYADAAKAVFEGAQRLHEIIDSMLDVAKIDTQDLALQSEPVSLEYVLNKASKECSEALEERQLKVELGPEISKLPQVQGDSIALQKVFRHLLINAVKYTPDGGAIVLAGAEVAEEDTRFPQGGVEVIVTDTGIGIDPRYIDLIFTKFYQTGDIDLHSSGKAKFKGGGPGLGLAIVRGIVSAMGGLVWAESPGYDEEKNPGSSFHVVLPRSSQSTILNFHPKTE